MMRAHTQLTAEESSDPSDAFKDRQIHAARLTRGPPYTYFESLGAAISIAYANRFHIQNVQIAS